MRRKAAKYRKNNREKVRAYTRRWMRRWYRANPRAARKRLKTYRLRNPEKWRAYDREVYRRKLKTDPVWMRIKLAKGRAWAKRNPEKQRQRVGRYRVLKLGAKGSHTFRVVGSRSLAPVEVLLLPEARHAFHRDKGSPHTALEEGH
jgi:hypothetical protein